MTQRLTDIALADGLSQLVLRRAAKRLATSDRMLIYYFGTKSAIVYAVLTCISERQSAMLAARSSGRPRSPQRLLDKAWSIVSDPKFVPFMRVWAEVISRGSRGEEPYETLGGQMISSWLSWLETRLAMPVGNARSRHAAAIVTILLGATLLEMSHRNSTRGVAKLLGAALRTRASSHE
jgi:AcrR family transcriptional regulator